MSNTIPDPAEPIGNVTLVKDFLPLPEQLVPKKNTVRVTMEFTKESKDSNVPIVNSNYQPSAIAFNPVNIVCKQWR